MTLLEEETKVKVYVEGVVRKGLKLKRPFANTGVTTFSWTSAPTMAGNTNAITIPVQSPSTSINAESENPRTGYVNEKKMTKCAGMTGRPRSGSEYFRQRRGKPTQRTELDLGAWQRGSDTSTRERNRIGRERVCQVRKTKRRLKAK